MITTPSMGLKRWNDPNDIFSYTELSDNFALLDSHDHTTGKGVQIPTGGIANLAVTDTQIANNAITAGKIASDAVTTAKILNSNVTVSKLETNARPVTVLAPWHTRHEVSGGIIAAGTVAGTYVFSPSATGAALATTNAISSARHLIGINASDPTVPGLTTNYQLQVTLVANAVAPAMNFVFGLYPVTAVGGTLAQTTITLGTLITNSTITFNAPGASTINGPSNSNDFTIGGTGLYVMGVVLSGTVAANSALNFNAQLMYHHV